MKTSCGIGRVWLLAAVLTVLPWCGAQAAWWSGWFGGGAPGNKPAVEIPELTLNGALDGENVSFALTFTAQVNRADAELTLARGPVTCLEGELPKGAKLQHRGDAYVLVFPSRGEQKVNFRFASRALADDDWRETSFILPEATVRKLALACDRDNLDVQLPGAMNVRREKDAAGKTVVGAFLSTSPDFAMRWKPEVRKLEGELAVSCDANLIAVARTGALQLDAVFNYRVVQGLMQKLELEVPAALQVTQVRGADIREWTIDKRDGGSRVLSVTLNRPKDRVYQLQVEGEMVLPAFPAKADLPFLTPKGVIRTSGFLMLGADSAIKLLVNKASGLTQIDQTAFPLVRMELQGAPGRDLPGRSAYAYQFASLPCQMELAADDIVTGLFAEDRLVLALENNSLVLTAVAELDVRDAPARDITIQTGTQWVVANVAAANLADYDVRDRDGGRFIQVWFKQAETGRVLVEVRLERSLDEAAKNFDAPPFRVQGAKSERGTIVFKAEQGVRLKPETLANLREVHTGSLPTRVPGAQSAFRFKDADWSARLAVEKAAAAVHAEVFHLVSIGEGAMYGSCSFTFNVGSAPVKQFRVRVPAACQNVEFTGRDIRGWQKDAKDPEIYTVTLQEKVSGDYTLLVTYSQPLDDKDGTVVAGVIQALDAESETGYIALAGAASLAAGAELGRDANVLALNSGELPQEYALLINDPVLKAYKFVGQPHGVQVKVTRYATEPLLGQVADHQRLETRISEAGEAVTTAAYFVKNTSQPYFRVTLPEGARLWTASVDDRKVQALDEGKGVVLVPVDRRRDPNQALKVTVVYAEQHGKTGWWRRMAFQAPKAGSRSVFASWNFQAPERFGVCATGGNMASLEQKTPRLTALARTVLAGVSALLQDGAGWLVLAAILLPVLWTLAYNRGRGAAGHWISWVVTGVGVVALILFGGGADWAFWRHLPRVAEQGWLVPRLELSKPVTLADSALQVNLAVAPAWFGAGWNVLRLLAGAAGAVLALTLLRRWCACRSVTCALAVTALVWGLCGFAGLVRPVAVLLLALPFAAVFRLVVVRAAASGRRRQERDDKAMAETEAAAAVTPVPPPAAGGASGAALVLLLASGLWLGGTGDTSAGEVRKMQAAEAAKPAPAAPVMTAVSATVTAPDVMKESGRLPRTAAVALDLEFEADAGTVFTVLPAPAVLADYVLDRKRLELTALRDGYRLSVLRSGKQTVKLNYLAPVTGSAEGGWGVDLALPANVKNRVRLTVPGIGWDVQSAQAVSLRSEEKDGNTLGTLVLGPWSGVRLGWVPRVRKTELEKAAFFCEVNSLALFQPGLVSLTHQVGFQIAQGELQSLNLQVPAGMNVTAVSGAGVSTWRFDPETRLVEVLLAKPVTGGYLLTVVTQVPRESLPYAVELAVPAVQGASRQRGTVALACVNAVQIRPDEPAGLSGMNTGDFALGAFYNNRQIAANALEVKRAFRYQQLPAGVKVTAEKVLPEIRVAESSTVDVSDERVVLSSALQVTVAKAGVFSVRLDIPANFDVESLTGQEVSHWDEVRDDGHGIIVHFTRQVMGTRTLNLVLSRMEKGLPPELAVPRVSVRDAFKQAGTVVLSGERGVRFTAVKREGVTELNPRELGIEQPGYLAFRLLRPDWEVALRTEALEPVVKAEVVQRVDLSEGMAVGRAFVQYGIEHAGVKLFRVQAPVPGAALTVSGRNVARVQPADKAKGIWEIELANKVEKEYRLEVSWQTPRPDPRRETVAQLQTLGTDSQKGWLVVFAGGRLQVQPQAVPAGMTAEDSRGVPARFGAGDLSGAVLCYRTTKPESVLDLAVVRHNPAEVLAGKVNRLRLNTVVSNDLQMITQAVMTLQVNALPRLEVRLPDAREELWSVFVNGRAVQPLVRKEKERAVFMIPLEPGSGTGAETSVEFLFGGAASASGSRQRYEGPSFNLPMADIQWDFHLPPDFRYHGVEGTLRQREAGGGAAEVVQVFTVQNYTVNNLRQIDDAKELAQSGLAKAELYAKSGRQIEARQALQSAIAYSQGQQDLNEDARIQFRTLAQQQAKVGLVNRRNALKMERNAADEQSLSQMRGFNGGNFNDDFSRTVEQSLDAKENESLNRVAGKILDQQAEAEAEINPIRITLPTQGKHLVFYRELQIQENVDMWLQFKAGGMWLSRVLVPFLVALGVFAGAWICLRVAAAGRRCGPA